VERIFVVPTTPNLFAISSATGDILWDMTQDAPISTKVVASPDNLLVYVITQSGVVSAQDQKTGEKMWSVNCATLIDETNDPWLNCVDQIVAESTVSPSGLVLFYGDIEGNVKALQLGTTILPSVAPTEFPTALATKMPSASPTSSPTESPASAPTSQPTMVTTSVAGDTGIVITITEGGTDTDESTESIDSETSQANEDQQETEQVGDIPIIGGKNDLDPTMSGASTCMPTHSFHVTSFALACLLYSIWS
jgi:PQQ-like domain